MAKEKDQQQVLKELNDNTSRMVSFSYQFFLGIIRGLGTAIGATIIAGIIFAIISWFIGSIEDIPVIGDFLQETGIEEQIPSNQ